MATTLNPARPFPGAGVYPLDSGHFDEAVTKTGTARPPYVAVIDALARQNLVELRERVRSNAREIGLSRCAAQGRSDRQRVAGRDHELADDQVRAEFRGAVADPVDPDLDHGGAAARV